TGLRRIWPGGCCTCWAPACWCCWTGPSMATCSSPRSTRLARCCCAAPSPPAPPRWCAPASPARTPGGLRPLPDASYLSRLHGLDVRIIEADVAMTGADGSSAGDRYRLITTLLERGRHPAFAVVRLYHERREIESAFLALRATLLGGRVLRSGDRPGVEQELWGLLILYQLLRMAMVTAVETRPGTDPDRASFTTALEAARDQLTAAG